MWRSASDCTEKRVRAARTNTLVRIVDRSFGLGRRLCAALTGQPLCQGVLLQPGLRFWPSACGKSFALLQLRWSFVVSRGVW